MLKFLRSIFQRRRPAVDLALWPYPLPEWEIRRLLFHAIRVAQQTMPEKDADMVDLLSSPNPLEARAKPSRTGQMMTPDDLESFGLSRRIKMSADFFLCLHADARKHPHAAEAKLIRHSIAALANRRDLNRLVSERSPKQIVEFTRDEDTCCRQCRAFDGKTLASVAPDLPLPGCDAEICLCDFLAIIEF